MEKEKIKRIIDKKEVVSFDIFDTLLLRNVYEPTDIFRIMEKEILKEYGIKDFYDLRIECEAESRNDENKGETSLDEVYRLMEKRVGRNVDMIKQREIELELAFVDYNPFMKEIFDYAIDRKRKIILISDMYLPSDIIAKLLGMAGYRNVPIYVSCEWHANKGTMTLYEKVWKSEKIKKNNWVHIGDNRYSDYEKAKEFGIDAILYKNVRSMDDAEKPKSLESSILRGIQNNYLYNGNEVSYWEKFGVLYASPIYYGFTNWIFRLTKDEDNLYFLARDGYIVKKIYDEFKRAEGSKIVTHYLYCSRKTFQLPALLHKTKDELMNYLIGLTDDYDVNMTIEDVLTNLNLDCGSYKEELEIFGLDNCETVVNKKNFYQVKKFLKYIYKDIEVELEKSEKVVLAYLKQEGVLDCHKISIMDVGWGGSLQEAIGLLTGKEIMGYYFGTIPTNKVNILSNSLGYVFDEAKPSSRYMEVFNVPMMYEFIFSAPHGTTVGFRREGGKIVADIDQDDDEYVKTVDVLQNAAMKIIRKYLKYTKFLKNISVDDCIFNYREMIARRDFEDVNKFLKLTNSVLYSNTKNKYVEEFDEKYIYDNYDEFLKRIHKAMWRDSYLVKGINTVEQWNNHKRKLDDLLARRHTMSLGKRALIKKGIKHPVKSAKFIRKTMIGK